MDPAFLERIRRNHRLREAEGYLELGLFERAMEVLDRLPEGDRECLEALLIRAEVLRHTGQYRSALEILERLAEKDPDNVGIRLAMGWCHKRIGRIDLACADLETAKQVDPHNALVLYNLACYYSLAGKKQEALTYLGEALRREPGLRTLIDTETDFDALRADPEFIRLVYSP